MNNWRLWLGATVLGVVIVNIIYAWASFPDLSDEELKPVNKAWRMQELPSHRTIQLAHLLETGFWGQIPSGQPAESEGGVSEQQRFAVEEAKALRRKVTGIVSDSGRLKVLVKVGARHQGFNVGDQLPNTSWVVVDIQADHLKLERQDGESKDLRVLKLFSTDALLVDASNDSLL